MKKQSKVTLSMVAALALVAAGCSSTDDKKSAGESTYTTSADEQCTADRMGGKVTVAVGQETTTLDPVTQNSGSNGGTARAAIYDTLLRYDPETNAYEPHLAESFEGNEDSTEWKLVLREGISFSTGDDLTADVVKQSIQRHTAEGASSNVVNIIEFIDEMEVVDDRTLVFHLNAPFGTFPFLLAGTGGEITNPSAVKKLGDKFGLKSAPGMGLGPYEVVRFAPGEELVMKARDDYWGGPVCIEELRFIHIPSDSAAFDSFELDEAQIAYLKDAAIIDTAKRDGVLGYSSNSWAGAAVLLNNGVRDSDPATKDIRIREAVALAIDPEIMNKRRWEGLGAPGSGLIYPADEASVGGPKYDPERARELVTEAKADGWDGELNLTCPNDPSNIETAIAVKALLYDVGIEVDTAQVTTADLIQAVIIDANYDLACWGIGAQASSPYLALSGFHSESPSNYTGFNNADMDAAVNNLRAAGTPETQTAAMEEIQGIWNKEFPAVVYGHPESFIAIDKDVRGVAATSWNTLLFHDAYVD